MGCNYYLKQKTVYDPDRTLLFRRDSNQDVTVLNNGFVYNNTYYATIDELNKDYYELLHIGKSSVGWHFTLCIYPSINIKNLDDWRRELSNPDSIIIDEENRIISFDDMINTITNRYEENYDKDPTLWEEQALNHVNEFNKKHWPSARIFKTYEEYMEANHAERGLHGLWAHKSDGTFIHYTRTDGTYDLTEEVEFS